MLPPSLLGLLPTELFHIHKWGGRVPSFPGGPQASSPHFSATTQFLLGKWCLLPCFQRLAWLSIRSNRDPAWRDGKVVGNAVARREGWPSTLVLTLVLFLALALMRGSKSCSGRCQRDWSLCAVFCRVSTFLAGKELLPGARAARRTRSQVSGGAEAWGHPLCATEMSMARVASLCLACTSGGEYHYSPRVWVWDPGRAGGWFWGLITLGSHSFHCKETERSVLPSSPCWENSFPW